MKVACLSNRAKLEATALENLLNRFEGLEFNGDAAKEEKRKELMDAVA